MTIHVMIAKEMRDIPARNAKAIAEGKPLAMVPDTCAGQLHTWDAASVNPTNPNVLYAAEWDGVSPWVNVTVGDISAIKMAYMGWPMVDKKQWDTENPPVKKL